MSKNQLFHKYFFCLTFNLYQILYEWLHNKDTFFHKKMFDLKGHIRSNKALYVYIFSSNNSSVKPLLSLYASLSFLSLSHSSSLFLFPPPLHTPTLALYPPYASLSFLSPSIFFSLFLTLTYVLMDNFLSLFYVTARLRFENLNLLGKFCL